MLMTFHTWISDFKYSFYQGIVLDLGTEVEAGVLCVGIASGPGRECEQEMVRVGTPAAGRDRKWCGWEGVAWVQEGAEKRCLERDRTDTCQVLKNNAD